MFDKFKKVIDNYHKVVKPTLLTQGGEPEIHNWFYRLATNLLTYHGIFPKDASYVQAVAKALGNRYGEDNLYSHQILPEVSLDEIVSV